MSTDKDNPNLPPPRSVGSVKPKHIPATTIGKQANEKSHILRSNKQATAAAVNLHPQQVGLDLIQVRSPHLTLT